MAFNPQQIYPIDLNASKAVGVDIPFNGNAVFKSNYLTKDAIKNNLINFFLTNPGERYLNPTFGGGLRAFIFEQITSDNLDFLRENINDKLTIYFPNINVVDLVVSGQIDNNRVNVSLSYSVINTNITDNLEIQF
jgi:phage baseplate assembly protein W